jgi:hypothetical protein
VQTARAKLYLFVAIDRSSKFAFVQLVESDEKVAALDAGADDYAEPAQSVVRAGSWRWIWRSARRGWTARCCT